MERREEGLFKVFAINFVKKNAIKALQKMDFFCLKCPQKLRCTEVKLVIKFRLAILCLLNMQLHRIHRLKPNLYSFLSVEQLH